ncbi:MAG: hypothetical protein LBT46_10875 [Planctomycetaceae bacterium]|jgi:hypothetical protein|nr:hypothetical protein [Planctomycetaceae bacterium]
MPLAKMILEKMFPAKMTLPVILLPLYFFAFGGLPDCGFTSGGLMMSGTAAGEEIQPADPASAVLQPPAVPDNPFAVPPDKGLLLQIQKQLTFELQQTQRTLGLIDPNDTQLRTALETQQASLVKQLKDMETQRAGQGQNLPSAPPMSSSPSFGVVLPSNSVMPNPLPQTAPLMTTSPMTTSPVTMPLMTAPPHNPWSPQQPQELTELKASVEFLRQEIGELKSAVKALETQIQLLNRTVLLSDRVKEKE